MSSSRTVPGDLHPGAIQHLAVLGLAVDVDLPARELRREPDVLAAATDGLGELIVGDDELHAVRALVDVHAADLGRGDRVHDEPGRVRVPGDDVDRFAAELAHHRLDARPLEADAGADRIHVGVGGGDGDLGAVTGLAGAGLDADDAFVDLGHLHLEQLHAAGPDASGSSTTCGWRVARVMSST
jgi:hypothetical protein